MNTVILLHELDEAIRGFQQRRNEAVDRKDMETYTIQYTIEVALLNVRDAIARACE